MGIVIGIVVVIAAVRLLRFGRDMLTAFMDISSKLHEAAKNSDIEEMRQVLADGVDVNTCNRIRLTVLSVTADAEHRPRQPATAAEAER